MRFVEEHPFLSIVIILALADVGAAAPWLGALIAILGFVLVLVFQTRREKDLHDGCSHEDPDDDEE